GGGGDGPVPTDNCLAPTARCVRMFRLFRKSLEAGSFLIRFSVFNVGSPENALPYLSVILSHPTSRSFLAVLSGKCAGSISLLNLRVVRFVGKLRSQESGRARQKGS